VIVLPPSTNQAALLVTDTNDPIVTEISAQLATGSMS
jgi:hypothetical protein